MSEREELLRKVPAITLGFWIIIATKANRVLFWAAFIIMLILLLPQRTGSHPQMAEART